MNDQPIMRIAIDSKLFSNKLIQLINLVHLNLQIIFLSDLLEIGTNKVKQNIYEAKKDIFYQSVYNWPEVVPTHKACRL